MKLTVVTLIGLLGLLQYQLWMQPTSLPSTFAMRQKFAALQQRNTALARGNLLLSQEIQDLKQGQEAVLEQARSQMGLIKPGEVYYQVAA